MEIKHCYTCGTDKTLDDFYFNKTKGKHYARCKKCDNEAKKQQRMKGAYIAGFGNRITVKPNTYSDDVQKQETFEFMELMGWKFNKEKGIWYDNKIKNKDGKWLVKLSERKRNYYKPRKFSEKRAEKNKNKRYLEIKDIPRLTFRDKTFNENLAYDIMIGYYHHCYNMQQLTKIFPDVDPEKIQYIICRSTTYIKTHGTRKGR